MVVVAVMAATASVKTAIGLCSWRAALRSPREKLQRHTGIDELLILIM